MRIYIILTLFLLLTTIASTQRSNGLEPTTDKLGFMDVPPFVNSEANYIHYTSQLSGFIEKLKQLKAGKIDKLNIVHIGDSHLQAGVLPNELRRLLQIVYGHAGRGLIFPYQVAKTNAPFDVRSQSNIEWECSRNINLNHEVPVGLCGYSLRTNNSNFTVNIQLKNPDDHFDKVTIFGPVNQNVFDLELHNAEEGRPFLSKKIAFKAGTCFVLDQAQTSIVVKGSKSNDEQRFYTLQGLLLENTKAKGILYSSVGVNGATFYAYNRSTEFMEQLAALEPDLIILSLGTNEAADANMRVEGVKSQISTFLDALKKSTHCNAVLMVTPPDIYLRSRYRTRHPQLLAEMMHDLAKMRGDLAIWDFYEVMGGYGGINNWLYAHFAAKDRIHYTSDGYKLQAQLLFKALMKAVD